VRVVASRGARLGNPAHGSADGDTRPALDLLEKCVGGGRVSAGVEVVVYLECVFSVVCLEDVHREQVTVDRFEHGERHIAEAIGVAAPVDPGAR
jgi:hypothetical protein